MRCISSNNTISLQDADSKYAVQLMAGYYALLEHIEIPIGTECHYVEINPMTGYTEEVYVDPYGPTYTSTFTYTTTTPSGGHSYHTDTNHWNSPYTTASYAFSRGASTTKIGQTVAKYTASEGVWLATQQLVSGYFADPLNNKNMVIQMENVSISEIGAYIDAGYGGYWSLPSSGKEAWYSYLHYAIEKCRSRENFLAAAIGVDSVCLSEDPSSLSTTSYPPDVYTFTPGGFTIAPTYGAIQHIGFNAEVVITPDSIDWTANNVLSELVPSGSYNSFIDTIAVSPPYDSYQLTAETTLDIGDYWDIGKPGYFGVEEKYFEIVTVGPTEVVYYLTGDADISAYLKVERDIKTPLIGSQTSGGHPLDPQDDIGTSRILVDEIEIARYVLVLVPETNGLVLLEGQALKVPTDQEELFNDFDNAIYGGKFNHNVYSSDQYGADEILQSPTASASYSRDTTVPIKLIRKELDSLTCEMMHDLGANDANTKEWARTYHELGTSYDIAFTTAEAVGETAPVGGYVIIGIVIMDEYTFDFAVDAPIKYGYFETMECDPEDPITPSFVPDAPGAAFRFYAGDYILPSIRLPTDRSFHKTRIDYWNWEIVTV